MPSKTHAAGGPVPRVSYTRQGTRAAAGGVVVLALTEYMKLQEFSEVHELSVCGHVHV